MTSVSLERITNPFLILCSSNEQWWAINYDIVKLGYNIPLVANLRKLLQDHISGSSSMSQKNPELQLNGLTCLRVISVHCCTIRKRLNSCLIAKITADQQEHKGLLHISQNTSVLWTDEIKVELCIQLRLVLK